MKNRKTIQIIAAQLLAFIMIFSLVPTLSVSAENAADIAIDPQDEGVAELEATGSMTPTAYTVSIGTYENGEVTTDKSEACEGDTVTLTVTSAEGFMLDDISIEDVPLTQENENEYTFVMPAKNVTVEATFKAKPKQVNITYHSNNGTDETFTVKVNEGDDHDVVRTTLSYFKCEIDYWNTEADNSGDLYYVDRTISDITEDIDLYAFWRLPLNELDSFSEDGYEWSGKSSSPYTFTLPNDAVLYASITFPLNDSGEEIVINANGTCEIKGQYNNYDGNNRTSLTIKGVGDSSLVLGSIPSSGAGDTVTVETDVTVNDDVSFGASGGQYSKLVMKDSVTFTINGSFNVIEQIIMEGDSKLEITEGKLSFSNDNSITLDDGSEIHIYGFGFDESDVAGNEDMYCVLHKDGMANNDELESLIENGWIDSVYSFKEYNYSYYLYNNDKDVFETEPLVIKKPVTEYTVRFVDYDGYPLSEQKVQKGGSATAPADPIRGGYSFVGWDKSFDNVVSDLTITAVYRKITQNRPTTVVGNLTLYLVSFDTNGGSNVTSKNVSAGGKVIKPEDPYKEGFEFEGWYRDSKLNDPYDFNSIVTKSFTLYAKWNEIEEDNNEVQGVHDCPSLRFYDLDITQWYHFDTDYVIANDIFRGITKEQFSPNGYITRAMMITVLYRAEDEPEVFGEATFEDTVDDEYYAKAVVWGQQNGIIKGYSDSVFAPDQPIIREQIAAIMHRYAKYKGYDVSVGENTNILSYEDFELVSEYAIPAMQWAVGSGMIKGRTEKTLDPRDNAKRVEIAAMLHRFLEENK